MENTIRKGSYPHTSLSGPSELIDTTIKYFKDALLGSTDKTKSAAVIGGLFGVAFIVNIIGLFVLIIPATYGIGGHILYKESGWNFFQPGVGGARFVALNAIAWALYALSLILQVSGLALHHDMLLGFLAFAVGQLSFAFMGAALLVYQGPNNNKNIQITKSTENELKSETFKEESVVEYMIDSGDMSPTSLWWIFIGLQLFTTGAAFVALFFGEVRSYPPMVKIGATVTGIWIFAGCTAITHALGGQWMHINTSYSSFQPWRGGQKYVLLQFIGWSLFSIGQLIGILSIINNFQIFRGSRPLIPIPLMTLCGLCGIGAEFIITMSLFFFVDDNKEPIIEQEGPAPNSLMDFLVKTEFLGLNIIFGSKDGKTKRKLTISSPDDHLKGDERWKELTKDCVKTGDQYLIIGVGFVGKRLVQCLLDRGEEKIRLFDITPINPFPNDSRVEYIRGDVTNFEQISKACENVDTVYCTFAIIRFMDRLEHQAALSYKINCTGTEMVIKACQEQNVKRMIVTSSSHATTDEHSQPRFNRDENSPYVTRETAHNHYGWTKAIGDQMAIKANGSQTVNGGILLVSIVRPCSGVFGGDDRVSFEKAMDMGVFPGVGAFSVMDWVYVMNVVLGHLLCEQKLQINAEGVAGEAFNISNNEGVSMEEFFWSVRNIIDIMPKSVVKSRFEFMYVPMAPIWMVGYFSEWIQEIYKGKVSLGRDLDMLTPAMLATATMSYTYNSDKAKKYLGYEPAYTLDEAIQKSLIEYWTLHYPTKKTN